MEARQFKLNIYSDGQDALSHSINFHDKNYTMNRVVTDMDWSPQIP